MSLKSSTHTAGAAATVLVEGSPGSGNVAKKVAIIPDADILIGGADAQTFPVASSGITLDLVSGDDVYVKRAGVSDVSVSVLEVSV